MPHDVVEPLIEHVLDWRGESLAIDHEARLVRQLVLSGAESRNGHRYSRQALELAAPLYARKPVFLDHAANVARPFDRSTRDLVGCIENPSFQDGRILGDIQVLDTDAGRTFLALLESPSPAIGMSHVVLARRGVDPKEIEAIHDVVSVDAVVFPATTSGLREHADDPQASELQLLREQLDEVTRERDALATTQRELLEAEARRRMDQEIDSLLVAAELPDYAITPAFRQQLLSLPDAEARRRCLEDRARIVRESRRSSPVSHPRTSTRSSTDASFVSAIRGR